MTEQEEFEFRLRLEREQASGGQPPAQPTAEQPREANLIQAITGERTLPEWGGSIVNRAKSIFDPQTYKNIASGLSPAAWERANGGLTVRESIRDQLFKTQEQKTPEQLASEKQGLDQALSYAFMSPVQSVSRAVMPLLHPKTASQTAHESILKAMGDAGYSIPRQQIKPGPIKSLMERFGGREGIENVARAKNQPITNKLAAKALGLGDDAPITPEILVGLRDKAGEAYKELSKLGPLKADKTYADSLRAVLKNNSGASKDFPELANVQVSKLVRGLMKKDISSEGAVEMVKNLRHMGSSNSKSLVPADRLLGKAQREAADVIDDLLARHIPKGSNLAGTYKEARQLIAKTYTVEKALNPATGNVSAQEIAKQARKGVPLTGDLKTISLYGRAFGRIAREPAGGPPAGGLLEPLIYGSIGTAAAGPAGSSAALLPIFGKPIARTLGSTVPKQAPTSGMIPQHLLAPRALMGLRNQE